MPRYTDKQIADALIKNKGMVYVAALDIGCSPQTVRTRLAKSEKLRAVAESERGKMTDTAELKLATAIENGEPWAVQFYLKTQGKDRGYVERQETTGMAGKPLEIRYVNDWRDSGPDSNAT